MSCKHELQVSAKNILAIPDVLKTKTFFGSCKVKQSDKRFKSIKLEMRKP